MWSAIRSDLKEFVTSVADDSNTVLTKIDTSIKDLDRDDESNLSYADSLSDLDTSGDVSQELDPTQLVPGDEYAGNSTGYEATGIISEPSDEAMRRMGLEETYSVPLLKDELNGDKQKEENVDVEKKNNESPSSSDNHDDDEGDKENEAESDKVSDSINTKESGVQDECDDVDDDDEEKEIKRFLKSFDVQAQTEEISKILTKHPDTVGLFFENLVPVVITYEQFWQRYFYRCDVHRIALEWDEEEERVRLERQEMIDKGVKSVKNIWGGALKAFQGVASQKQEPKKASIYEKYQAEVEEQQRAMVDSGGSSSNNNSERKETKGVGLGFFGSGRPPFAMNTAGSGDDDEEYIVDGDGENDEDDDEDDELGWGSDDEEESESEEEDTNDNDSGRNADTSEDEIVFGAPTLNPLNDSEELERLREELSQVADERDKLQITVESQSKDLAHFHNTDDTIDHNPKSHNDEIELLKMSIFEKDSELAALKANLQDTQEDNSRDDKNQATIKVTNEEIAAMTVKLTAKDNEISRLQLELDMVSSAKEQADSELEVQSLALKETNERANQLSIELEGTKEVELQQTAKVAELNKTVDEAKLAAEAMQATQGLSEQTIKDLTARVSEFESSIEQESRLKAELEETREKLEHQKNDFADRMAAEIEKVRVEHTKVAVTPGSVSPQTSTSSSVVNVKPQPIESNLDSATNEEEDDWGDSWSEGDD